MKTKGVYERYNTTSVAGRAGYDMAEDIVSKSRVFEAHVAPRIKAGGFRDAVDIGCGYGIYVDMFRKAGLAARGVDLSGEQVETGRRRFGLDCLETGDGLDFLRAMPAESVDCVLLFDILEHLPLDICIEMLAESRRVLRTGGEAIIMTPNIHAPFCPTFAGDVTHVRAFSRASLRQVALMAGFTSVTTMAQKLSPCSFLSAVRIITWHAVVSPLLGALAVAMHGTNCGGVFTPNLVAILKKESSAEDGR